VLIAAEEAMVTDDLAWFVAATIAGLVVAGLLFVGLAPR